MKYENKVNEIALNSSSMRDKMYRSFLENCSLAFYRESWAKLSDACFPFYMTDVKGFFDIERRQVF